MASWFPSVPAEILISFVLQADRQLVTGSILFCLFFVAGSMTSWIGVCGVSGFFVAGARGPLSRRYNETLFCCFFVGPQKHVKINI